MDTSWIEHYGVWAVLAGAMLEGETVLILAGYAASRGYLGVVPVLVAGAVGGALADNVYFLLGRTFGAGLIRRFPRLRRLRARAVLFLRRWGRATALLMRFAYGMRIALPVSMGAARFPPLVFFVFNALGAIGFTALYVTLGFLFGTTLENLLGRLRHYDVEIVLGVVALGALIWAVREWRLRRMPEPKEE